MASKIGLLTASAAYKPFRYPWAFDMWKKQQQVHWMPEEVPLGDDMKDWAINLSDAERNLLLVSGAVPGATGGDVVIKPAVKA